MRLRATVTPTVGALCPFGKARFTSPAIDNASASGKFPDVRLWTQQTLNSLAEMTAHDPLRTLRAWTKPARTMQKRQQRRTLSESLRKNAWRKRKGCGRSFSRDQQTIRERLGA